jgi:hypothetical protein
MMIVATKNFKFIHDEIHEGKFPKTETILNLRTDLKPFELFDCLREHKASKGQTSIDIFEVWEEQDNNEWKRLDRYYNDGVKREPIHEERLYYYQMDKDQDRNDLLKGLWKCCGLVSQDTVAFYKRHFSMNYHNGLKKDQDDCKVVIVKGFFGNVAAVDAREIREDDIVEKYNF